MASYNTSEFRKGLKVELDGEPYLMIEMDFMKPGKGQAVYRCKLKNLITGRVLDRNYRSGETMEAANIEETKLQYLYNDSTHWHFMDPESFEQHAITKDQLDDAWKWLIDESMVNVLFWNDRPVTISPPNHVELKVTYCEPGARGNTATNVQKPATLETGAVISVPFFVNNGDVVRVDTRTGEYTERVEKAST
ncbi:MAG: elongation factor P [Planctomycetota bacterium]